jgi:hypothetical protein
MAEMHDPFAALPHALALTVFALLPLDVRLRCSEVCRGWRATLSDTSFWRRLDLSASGVSPKRVTDGLLRAAAARAGGQLEALDVSGCDAITREALVAVAAANTGALRELRLCGVLRTAATLEALLRAAPLCAAAGACVADVTVHRVRDARRMLRGEPPFGALHLHELVLVQNREHVPQDLTPDSVEDAPDEELLLFRDMGGHTSLRRLTTHKMFGMPGWPRGRRDALVAAALACGLTRLCLVSEFGFTQALARLLAGGTLTELVVENASGAVLLDDPQAATVLGDALRASSTLTALTLQQVRLWKPSAASTALLGALTAHPSLRALNVSMNEPRGGGSTAAAGAALGALVAANAPALRELNVRGCNLGDDGLGPLVDALPANTHLRKLTCGGNNLSEAFVRERLLPAVRANSSLRELQARLSDADTRDVKALLERRGAAAEAQ